jgi:hypothetical protein
MKRLLFVVLVGFSGGLCFAGRCDDLFRLCDIAESYSKKEAEVVALHRPPLQEYAALLLAIRLKVLAVQRERLTELERESDRKIVVRQGGLSFFRIGTTEPSYSGTPEMKSFVAYVSSHEQVMKSYDEASTEFASEIVSPSIGDWRESHEILKRYIPDLDEE